MASVQTLILPVETLDEASLSYVVIAAMEKGLWIFVRHRDRSTWEMPAGHIERGETAQQAAIRELKEETGTQNSSLVPLCDYQVKVGNLTESGRLYFAEIHERKALLEHEITELQHGSKLPAKLTYPEVQTLLFKHAKELLRS